MTAQSVFEAAALSALLGPINITFIVPPRSQRIDEGALWPDIWVGGMFWSTSAHGNVIDCLNKHRNIFNTGWVPSNPQHVSQPGIQNEGFKRLVSLMFAYAYVLCDNGTDSIACYVNLAVYDAVSVKRVHLRKRK